MTDDGLHRYQNMLAALALTALTAVLILGLTCLAYALVQTTRHRTRRRR